MRDNRALIHEAFLSEAYTAARRRVFRQLVEAMLFEGLLCPAVEEREEGLQFVIPGRDLQGSILTYTCSGRRRFTFGRIRLSEGPLLRQSMGIAVEAVSIRQFLDEVWVSDRGTTELVEAFVKELEETLLKEAVSRYTLETSGCDWINLDYDTLEGRAATGHPYHPSFRSRVGFRLVDHLNYGPEFLPELHPVWVAVKQSLVHLTGIAGKEPNCSSELALDPSSRESFKQALRLMGYDAELYEFLPVHPWQWAHELLPNRVEALRRGDLVYVGPSEDVYVPQQSIRTLSNRTSPLLPSLKLPLRIRNTSSQRTLSPPTVAAAPAVSDWLSGLVEKDPYLSQIARIVVLREFAGAYVDSNLACIWRESIHPSLLQGEQAVPMFALTELIENNTPYIDSWIKEWGLDNWLRALFEVVMLPIVHLLGAHGTALECHAQNMILIHNQGLPVRTAWKDFHEGVEYCPELLQEPADRPQLNHLHPAFEACGPNEYYEVDDPLILRDTVLDCLFHMNLGELALQLEEKYSYSEKEFWGLAADVLLVYLNEFPDVERRLWELQFFTPEVRLEQLCGRKLLVDREELVHTAVNPICAILRDVYGYYEPLYRTTKEAGYA